MRKWLILALTLAWLAWELVAAFDGDPHTWPLTQVIVTYVPAYIAVPAAVLLAAWLPAHFISNYLDARKAAPVTIPSQPTQTRHPWRATLRTVFAAGVSLLTLAPVVATTAHVDAVPAVAQVLAVSAVVTRVLAMPGVDAWLRRYASFLASSPGTPFGR